MSARKTYISTHTLAAPPLTVASVNTKASKQNHCPSIEELWLQLHSATNNATWMSEYYEWAPKGDTWFLFFIILNIPSYNLLSAIDEGPVCVSDWAVSAWLASLPDSAVCFFSWSNWCTPESHLIRVPLKAGFVLQLFFLSFREDLLSHFLCGPWFLV